MTTFGLSAPSTSHDVKFRDGVVRLPFGWPLIWAFWGYSLWWALGASFIAIPVGAGLTLVAVARSQRRLVIPKWGGVWMLFLAWTVISSTTLPAFDRAAAWGFRELSYVSCFAILIVVVTLPGQRMSTERIARMVLALWYATVIGGWLGVLFPHVQFSSLTEILLPGRLANQPFINSIVHPAFGDISGIYGTPRPRTLYSFTNEWGAAMGVLTPFALFARSQLQSRRANIIFWLTLIASVVPIVESVNRGLWISLVVALAVVLLQGAIHRKAIRTAGILLVGILFTGLLWATPLSTVIAERVGLENVSTRQNLASGAVDYALASPLIGYGAPVQSTLDVVGLSVGTHGQLWTLLVSHGIPGATFYILFFVLVLVTYRRVAPEAWWLQSVIVVLLVQLPFYNSVGVPLAVAMVAVGLLVREQSKGRGSSPPGQGLVSSSPATAPPSSLSPRKVRHHA